MGVVIRTAGEADREAITELLDKAFHDDPVSAWIFPDESDRHRKHPLLMAAFLDIVLAEGRVDVTDDGAACALWLSMPAHESTPESGSERASEPGGADAESDDGPARLREAIDPDNDRLELVGRATAEVHPEGRAHEYLWLIAVAPERQGEGLGTALIEAVLDRCDREGLAAYLEASNSRSRALYERLGFTVTDPVVHLPDGPDMWPMWRDPRA
ncbi:GNAT family N-acetyltransferase [Streptomyces cavernae]|uniref:GNAT family N-acetyltransferase n=1 Tax=Streptomyces cavernae TaxID=2259034 RepID=UPI000FEC0998|nr:GNAT family N-acetyltransferase [Streptomyces cavernae]